MKHRLVDLLTCPTCGGGLSVDTFSSCEYRCDTRFDKVKCTNFCSLHDSIIGRDEISSADCTECYRTEIIDGILRCACGRQYPIIGGVPRMLPESLLSGSLLRYHGDFLERYKDELDIDLTCGRGSAGEKKEETLSSFSFQWTEFSEMFPEWEQNFKDYLEPLVEQSFFRGKLVLDAGCGFGRHAYYSAKYGAEVVGFDLSEAVQTAHKNTREFAEVHIVQGDIYALPFRAEFDFIYSIGVLHHLPDPVSGLADLSNCLKQGGQIYVWVYGKRRGVKRIYVIVDFLRKFTTKMSYRPLYLFTLGLACLSHLSFVYPYKLLNSIGLKRIASILPFTAYARFPFRVSHTDWFDRLSVPLVVYLDRDDVEDWFENVGLNDVRISQKNGASWRLVGTRP